MKIRAIRVAKPRKHRLKGGEKFTSIVKDPVSGPVATTAEGLAGDGVGDRRYHGAPYKAVYAYGTQHYPWWVAQYPDLEFPEGVFGENLLVDGLDERELCVGDRLRCGAVLLQVTTPRMPCQTLNLRMGDKAFGKKFLAAERPGVYFQVLEAGPLQAGDTLERVERGATGLTVHEAFLAYAGLLNSEEVQRKAAAEPRLVAEWKERIVGEG